MFLKNIITKIIAVIMSIIALFGSGNTDNISLSVKTPVTTKSEVLEYTVENNSGKKISGNYHFTLEKKENGEWTYVDNNLMVIEVQYELKNGQSKTFNINIPEAFSGYLAQGEYRLSVRVFFDNSDMLISPSCNFNVTKG